MGPLGGQEIFLIFVVILLLFGAKKLPELARGMGKSLGEFKRARDEFEHEIMHADENAYHGQSEIKDNKEEKKEAKEEAKQEEEIAAAADVADESGISDSSKV